MRGRAGSPLVQGCPGTVHLSPPVLSLAQKEGVTPSLAAVRRSRIAGAESKPCTTCGREIVEDLKAPRRSSRRSQWHARLRLFRWKRIAAIGWFSKAGRQCKTTRTATHQ